MREAVHKAFVKQSGLDSAAYKACRFQEKKNQPRLFLFLFLGDAKKE